MDNACRQVEPVARVELQGLTARGQPEGDDPRTT
jgi:hypothetical protein